MPNKPNSLKLAARIALIVSVISTILFYLSYFQIRRQLVSPLIPKDIFDKLTGPSLEVALISTLVILIAAFAYYKSKFIVSLSLCGLMLIFHFLIPYLSEMEIL